MSVGKQFAAQVRAIRKKRELTQEALAQRADVSTASVSKWERAIALPSLPILLNLAGALDTSIEDLLGLDAPVETNTNRRAQLAEVLALLSGLSNPDLKRALVILRELAKDRG